MQMRVAELESHNYYRTAVGRSMGGSTSPPDGEEVRMQQAEISQRGLTNRWN